jgi:hypothetical protein
MIDTSSLCISRAFQRPCRAALASPASFDAGAAQTCRRPGRLRAAPCSSQGSARARPQTVQCSSAAYSLAWCAPQPLLVVGLDAELALYAVRANPAYRVSTPATLPPHAGYGPGRIVCPVCGVHRPACDTWHT